VIPTLTSMNSHWSLPVRITTPQIILSSSLDKRVE
jgi:hypothetical protein